ncbi:MAG TPA: hypothetical protein PLG08_12465, partial [Chitinophagaceae bacterium]|nr:hypothetical protein [Chitinophagaceae bacterium]
MNEILFLLIGLIAGTIITWIIRKLIFEKEYVQRSLLAALEKELASICMEKGRLEERLSLLV